MSDTNAAGSAGAAAAAAPAGGEVKPALLAGKYENADKLAGGITEIRNKVGLPPLADGVKLIGEGGVYADTAAAEAGYKHLESMLGKPKADPDAGKALEIKEPPAQPTEKGIKKVLKAAGYEGKEAELAEQWKTKKALTPEQYTAFEKAGRDREEVDEYFAGLDARARLQTQTNEQIRNEAAQIAGGPEQLNILLTKAHEYVPAAEMDDIKTRLADPKNFRGAIRDMAAMYAEAAKAGKAEPLIQPSGTGATIPTGAFESSREMHAAMKAAEGKHGDWSKDSALMARLNKTPKHIRAGV